MILRFPVFLFSCALALFGATGCGHYQLGTEGKLSFSSLYLEPVENKTLLPQASALLSTQVRDSFAQDARVALANSAETADASLSIVIRRYGRDVASVRENDTGLARKFTLTLEVACTLRDRRTGQVLFADRLVSAQRDAFTDGGQLQSEYQALPLLAAALAKKINHAVLDVW